MKKKILYILGIVIIIAGTFHAGTVFGTGASQPGSVGDPLVTLSYLETRLSEGSAGKDSGYEKITLDKNQVLLLGDGSEAVIYSGTATVTGSKGLINLTSGEMFQNGKSVVKYQVFLSPANTSGFKAGSEVITYISGKYTIK